MFILNRYFRKTILVQPKELNSSLELPSAKQKIVPARSKQPTSSSLDPKRTENTFATVVLSIISHQSDIRRSTRRNIVRLLFWAAISLTFGYVAGKFSVQFYLAYRKEPTISSLEIMFEQRINLPVIDFYAIQTYVM